MNILFVADVSIARVIGGAERVLFEQSTRLAQRGHNVHILTRRLPDHRDNQEVIQGTTEWRYDIDQKSIISFLRSTWQKGRRLFESLQRRYGFDCINFHQPFSSFGVVRSPLSNKTRKVYTCHSLSFEEFISRNARPAGSLDRVTYMVNVHTRRWIEKDVLKRSDAIIVLSRYTKRKLWGVYGIPSQEASIIPGGVDPKRFHPAVDKTEIRRRLSIPHEKVILFTVRNLVPRMGLENLIVAINKVVKSGADVFLVLGGEGPLRCDLVTLADNLGVGSSICFTGFLSEEDLPQYYRMADLFVLPTRELEGFGLVTLEAMASGLPVLGTPVGGTKEILVKFDPNLLFKDIDPNSIAALIIENYHKIRKNPKGWKDLSRNCRGFVERYYSWEKNVDAIEKVFSLNKKRPPIP